LRNSKPERASRRRRRPARSDDAPRTEPQSAEPSRGKARGDVPAPSGDALERRNDYYRATTDTRPTVERMSEPSRQWPFADPLVSACSSSAPYARARHPARFPPCE
jgi:hypothetical protein